ncbi:uncharacterized protein LOC113003538 [Solenopsis invicta]|uniref:uncharacterized protein LOC113003538 n=1 Tax=Solenopsis invicta TaxID=13686 RepID=UPI000E33E983|nr:uncharacterized protein LOC113003538 [Solenopsis invicta]
MKVRDREAERRKRLQQAFRFAYREREVSSVNATLKKRKRCIRFVLKSRKPILSSTQKPAKCPDEEKKNHEPRVSDSNFLGKSTTDRCVIRRRLGERRASGSRRSNYWCPRPRRRNYELN